MKIVVLDYDGVINSAPFLRRVAQEEHDSLGEASAIDPVAIERLNRLVEATGAEIVVSSSWRHGRTVAELYAILCKRGFRGTVIGKTPDYADCCRAEDRDGTCVGSPRGHEIREWLTVWPAAHAGVVVESYVIFDDNSDMDGVRDRFIQTSFDTGLTDEHVDRAIEMLGGAA